MTCFIKSFVYENIIDVWNNKHDTNGIFNNGKSTNMVEKHGNGICVKINEDFYVLTCHHIFTDDVQKITVEYATTNNEKKQSIANIKYSVECFDFAMLSLNDIDKNIKFVEFDIFDSNLTDDGFIQTFTDKFDIDNLAKKDMCLGHNLMIGHDLPQIVFSMNKKYIKGGISGSPVYNKYEKLIGMVLCTSNDLKNIFAFNAILLKNLATNYKNNHQIKSMVFSSKFIKFKFDGSEKNADDFNKSIIYYGHLITKNTSMCKYNEKNNKIINNDLLFQIDDKNINNNGTVYNDYLQCDIKIPTYFLIQNIFGHNIKACIVRNNCIEYIDMQQYNIHNLYTHNFSSNFDYVYNNGVYIIELNCELVKYFKQNNIELCNLPPFQENEHQKHVIAIIKHKNNILAYKINKISNKTINNIDQYYNLCINNQKQTTYNCISCYNSQINIIEKCSSITIDNI